MSKVFVALVASMFVGGILTVQADDKTPPTEAEKAATAKIRQLGGRVSEVAQNDNHLEVSYFMTGGKVTDEALAPLKDLAAKLVLLNLQGTEITDAGLANIKDLKGLTKLHLEKTKIGDAGLEHLKGLENLTYLNLYGTPIGDAGLKHLEGLKKLKKLYVWQTQVTDAGVAALKAAVPELTIVRGP